MTVDERGAAVATMLAERGTLRMAIRGRSMHPSVAEPMVLQIGPVGPARIGDVLIFRNDGVTVAHRIVALDAEGYQTAGDAQPHVVERVPHERIVGRVLAIWSDGSPTARRIDDRRHRARAWYFARFHRARRAARNAREKVRDLFERAQPHRRARSASRLVEAITAVQRGDATALFDALDRQDAAFFGIAERHRCAAVIGEAARRLHLTNHLAPTIAAPLRQARLNAIIGSSRLQRAVGRTVDVLGAAHLQFALLKGAARVYGADPGAAYHPSDDVDILVRARDVDRAVAALLDAGWQYHDPVHEIRRYRNHHHHVASLFAPNGDFPVEVHHQLAEPGNLSIDTSWDALRTHLVPLDGGRVLRLDAVGTALHLAIHAIGLTRLRDVVLLAGALVSLTDDERRALASIVSAERRDPVRLAAAIELAARVADVPWTERAGAAAYIRWALRREDLPTRLRLRCDAADTYFAQPQAPWTAVRGLVPWWSHGAQVFVLPGRVLARCASNALALAYAMRMEPKSRGTD